MRRLAARIATLLFLPGWCALWSLGLVCWVVLSGGLLRAEEEKEPARDQPAEEMTAAERDAVLKRVSVLSAQVADLYAQGKYGAAVPVARGVLDLLERALGPDHPSVATSLNNLAVLLQSLGAREEVRPLLERALRIKERTLGREHPLVATSLNNLALLHWSLAAYEEARPLFERALRINESALGPDHPMVATSLSNLAEVYKAMGAYAKARPLYERALRVSEKALGPDHPSVATNLGNLALLLKSMGAYDEARPLYERALRIDEAVLGPDHPDVATSLNNLAGVYRAMGAYDEALLLYERAVRINETSLGPNHPTVAMTLGNVALLLEAMGAYEKAWPLFERALRVHETALGPNHPLVATSLSNLAGLLRAMGAFQEARPLYERALRINETALGPDHPSVAAILGNLARLLSDEGQHERAASLFERCLASELQNLRRSLGCLAAAGRRAKARSVRSQLDNWLRMVPRLRRCGYPEVLRFKGAVARAAAAELRIAREGGGALARRVGELRFAERRLTRLANSVPTPFPKDTYERRRSEWQEKYAKAGAERERLALALAGDFAPLRHGLERLDLGVDDVRARLAAGEVVVDVLESAGRYLAWILQPEGEVQRLDLGDADELERATQAFSTRSSLSGACKDSGAGRSAVRTVWELLVEPIEEHLPQGVHTLYICPDSALAAVPFVALPGKEPGTRFIDDYTIVHLAMAQDLVPWPNPPPPGQGALLVGAVDYEQAAEAADRPVLLPPSGMAAADPAPQCGSYPQLPATGEEVAFIAKELGEGASLLIGRNATEAGLRAEAKGKRLLHIATHGYVRNDLMRGLRRRETDEAVWMGAGAERQMAIGHDPLLLAGLAFAGANERDGAHGDDGLLTALEAARLDLDGVELVVLSACETALGKPESGEGVIGLVQGFQMAGAKRVIASLWKVDDEATRMLMQHLYDGMLREKDSLSPAEALREAQLKVRNSTGEGGRSFAHPRFWAGFVCYGK